MANPGLHLEGPRIGGRLVSYRPEIFEKRRPSDAPYMSVYWNGTDLMWGTKGPLFSLILRLHPSDGKSNASDAQADLNCIHHLVTYSRIFDAGC